MIAEEVAKEFSVAATNSTRPEKPGRKHCRKTRSK
jgi:hypothetical protein